MTLPLQRILMVEDEPDIQAVARLALEAIGGFSVRMCSSGNEALQAGPAFEPDLILLDIMMPGMDGPTTLRALRRLPETARTPVIFMTAKVQPHEIAQYKALGVLDVLAKPFDPMTLSTAIQAIWRRDRASNAAAELRALSESYATRIPEKLAEIERAWTAAQRSWAQDDLAALQRLAHTLNGTASTLGFRRLSDVAGALERHLGGLATLSAPDAEGATVERLIGALREAADERGTEDRGWKIEDGDRGVQTLHSPSSNLYPLSPVVEGERDNRLIGIAGVDAQVAPDLASQLGHFGYQVQICAEPGDLAPWIDRTNPAAIIAGDTLPGGVERLKAIRETWSSPRPIVLVSDRANLETRLRAVRAGVDAVFAAPMNTIALVDKLDALTSHRAPEPYRVLIVDDEPDLANHHAAKLREANMLTVVVSDPLDVMRPLAEFRPDLILMDMYMPGCDGMDLATVIRQQEDYIGIPIVFLSAETNRDMQLEAMRLGGDDFMTKPVTPDHLISAIASRVDRSRALRSFMVRDSLTGLFNHTATKERLEAELARASRNKVPMAFAIIDIDHFKSVNDTYGHPTGDRVLKSLARLLQQRLRRIDIIGRYGGEEFAVVLAGTDGPAAAEVIDEIRSGLAQIRQQAGDRTFAVTFSCGVASFPAYQDAPSLTDAADRALYQAKRTGRNRIVLAGEG